LWRKTKLLLNLFITAIIFNYFVLVLILLLNPHVSLNINDLLIIYLNLFIFFGPLWFFLTGILFFIIQFFSEKKYQIGIFSPPTITYFLSFTVLTVSFLLFLNYDYYFNFFSGPVKSRFVQILLVNLLLIITSIIFLVVKRINKKWIQILFLLLLCFNILNSFNAIIGDNYTFLQKNEINLVPQETMRRKMRIIIMDGLSLNFLQSMTSGQELLNFNHLLKNGIRCRISGFKPNFGLALLNSTLTGLKPSKFSFHSDFKFKFSGLKQEFNIFPRYIFFRYSANINSTSFYKKKDTTLLDNLKQYYQANNYKTVQLVGNHITPIYFKKQLKKNSLFIHLFSEILVGENQKYEIVRKSFFLDNYLKNKIPELKDNNIYYTLFRLPGLSTISRFFYQYHMSHIFGNISEKDKKQYGWFIKKYYEFYDSIVGNLISTTGENELLAIISFFEYEPLPVWRRILVNLFKEKGIYVYKSGDSRGTLLLYEKNSLKKDYRLENISIFDIFPTLLYYSGFQLSKDLQGEVIREIFTDEFVLNNPIDIITN